MIRCRMSWRPLPAARIPAHPPPAHQVESVARKLRLSEVLLATNGEQVHPQTALLIRANFKKCVGWVADTIHIKMQLTYLCRVSH